MAHINLAQPRADDFFPFFFYNFWYLLYLIFFWGKCLAIFFEELVVYIIAAWKWISWVSSGWNIINQAYIAQNHQTGDNFSQERRWEYDEQELLMEFLH